MLRLNPVFEVQWLLASASWTLNGGVVVGRSQPYTHTHTVIAVYPVSIHIKKKQYSVDLVDYSNHLEGSCHHFSRREKHFIPSFLIWLSKGFFLSGLFGEWSASLPTSLMTGMDCNGRTGYQCIPSWFHCVCGIRNNYSAGKFIHLNHYKPL